MGGNNASRVRASDRFETFHLDGEFDMRLMLVGKTGSGKSSVANTILGKELFKVFAGFDSGTLHSQAELETRKGVRVRVVDTCGLQDTRKAAEDVSTELKKSLMSVAPGPHAFILVLSPEKFTDEMRSTINTLEQLFPDFYEQTVIVFTKCEGQAIHSDIRKSDEIDQLCCKVNRRYVVFNNKEPVKAKRDAMAYALLSMVYDLYSSRGRTFFTSAVLDKAESAAAKRDEEIKRDACERIGEGSTTLSEELKRELTSLVLTAIQSILSIGSPDILARYLNVKQVNGATTASGLGVDFSAVSLAPNVTVMVKAAAAVQSSASTAEIEHN